MKRIAALDGVRGIAILLVLAGHFFAWPPGGRGVDLFFVLSGFLITTLLLEERERTGRIAIKAFYVRRARRLLPPLAVLLSAYGVIELIRGNDPLAAIAEYGLYGANVFIAYQAHGTHNLALVHLWSLAEEEQFYLVWPVILIALAKARRPMRTLSIVTCGLILFRFGVIAEGASWWHVYYPPQMRADGLLIGCIAAFVARRRLLSSKWVPVGAAFCFAGWWLLSPGGTEDFILGVPLFEVGSTLLLLSALVPSVSTTLLGMYPLAWIGRVSYSLYLWHVTLLWLFDHQMRLLVLLLSFAAATASYLLIEQPLRVRSSQRKTIHLSARSQIDGATAIT